MSAEHFDAIAGEYDESLPAHVVEHYTRKRLAYLTGLRAPGSALDVGCGTGVLAARLAAAGWDVTGCDPSDGMLDVLRRDAPGVTAVHAPGEALPFPDDAFDLVYCVAVMHHVAAPDLVRATLAEMVRVCRPGGDVVVWDHNPRNPYWRSLMARVPQDDGSERLIPEREVVGGLQAGGARVLASQPLGFVPDFVPPRGLRAMAVVERLVERAPGVRVLCAHNVVRATPQRS